MLILFSRFEKCQLVKSFTHLHEREMNDRRTNRFQSMHDSSSSSSDGVDDQEHDVNTFF